MGRSEIVFFSWDNLFWTISINSEEALISPWSNLIKSGQLKADFQAAYVFFGQFGFCSCTSPNLSKIDLIIYVDSV